MSINKCKFLVVGLMLGCAGKGFEEEESSQLSQELGQTEKEMSAKFSSGYTYGLSQAGTSKKCTVALGAGAGQTCLLPAYGTVRFKVTGNDPFSATASMSWKFQVRQALKTNFKTYVSTIYGYPFPFSVVEEDTANTWVEVKNGNCPNNGGENNIASYACIQWTLGNSTVVTETLAGDYKRFTGTMKLIIDVEKMKFKTGFFAPAGSTLYDEDYSNLMIHATHAIAPSVFGSGIYLNSILTDNTDNWSWSSPSAEHNGDYYHFGYTGGEACRTGSWTGIGSAFFSQAAGSCVN